MNHWLQTRNDKINNCSLKFIRHEWEFSDFHGKTIADRHLELFLKIKSICELYGTNKITVRKELAVMFCKNIELKNIPISRTIVIDLIHYPFQIIVPPYSICADFIVDKSDGENICVNYINVNEINHVP